MLKLTFKLIQIFNKTSSSFFNILYCGSNGAVEWRWDVETNSSVVQSPRAEKADFDEIKKQTK